MVVKSSKTCELHKDGVCALHGIEVERRKSDATITRLEIEVMKKEIGLIPGVLVKLNTIVGYSILATILILGGYYYSSEIKADSRKAALLLRGDIIAHRVETDKRISALAEQVSKLTTTVARNEEKHKALIVQMEILNDYLSQLLGFQTPEEKLP